MTKLTGIKRGDIHDPYTDRQLERHTDGQTNGQTETGIKVKKTQQLEQKQNKPKKRQMS